MRSPSTHTPLYGPEIEEYVSKECRRLLIGAITGRIREDLEEKKRELRRMGLPLGRQKGKVEGIPLVIHHPDLPPAVIRQPVSPLDVAPTLCHLLGFETGRTWIGDTVFTAGNRTVLLPNLTRITVRNGTRQVEPGAGPPLYRQYSMSLLNGGPGQRP